MDLYSSTNMMLAVDKPSDLADAIKQGGVPMQQIVATMLTKDGQYIRRERTFAGVAYNTVDTKVEKELAWKDDGEKNPIFLGIELEYDHATGKKKAVYKALKGHAILKRDGSVPSGFEIVTAPGTIAYHKKAFAGFFKKVPLKNYSNCGMHVHIGKKHLTEMQIGKIISFIYKKDNIPFITLVAGREYNKNHYCGAREERSITHGIYGDEQGVSRSGDKYQAVNTAKENTIEIRVFSPPITDEELFYKLEFVQALVDFTMPSVVSVKDCNNLDKFVSFVASYKKIYPNLSKFIGEM
jgi:hypothetical protein